MSKYIVAKDLLGFTRAIINMEASGFKVYAEEIDRYIIVASDGGGKTTIFTGTPGECNALMKRIEEELTDSVFAKTTSRGMTGDGSGEWVVFSDDLEYV